jgi:hypothetical protein
MALSDPEINRRTVSNARRMPVVHVAYEQYPSSQWQSGNSIFDISGEPRDKRQATSLDDTLENGAEK